MSINEQTGKMTDEEHNPAVYTEEEMAKVCEERDEMLDQCQAVEKAITEYAKIAKEYRLTAERETVATEFANEQLFKMRDDRDRWRQLRMDALDALSYWQAEQARMWTKGAMKNMTDHWAFNMLSQRHVLFEDRANKLAAKQGRNKPAVLTDPPTNPDSTHIGST